MEFLAGVVFTLFVGFIATRVLRKKYKIVKVEESESSGSGGGGRSPGPNTHQR